VERLPGSLPALGNRQARFGLFEQEVSKTTVFKNL
jgi:hypothetical protein